MDSPAKIFDARFIIDNQKKHPLEEIKKAVAELIHKNIQKPILLIIYDKTYRPRSIHDQFHLLLFIGDKIKKVNRHASCYAYVAACHKALESFMNEQVLENIEEKLLEAKALSKTLKRSHLIREDSLHLFYSINSALIHLYLFKKCFKKVRREAKRGVQYFKRLDKSSINKAFYQTCGNALRSHIFLILDAIVAGKKDDAKNYLDQARLVLFYGLLNRDENLNKFDEYLYYVKVFSGACDLHQCEEGHNIFAEKLSSLVKAAVRGQGQKKVDYIADSYIKFYREQLIVSQ